MRGNNILSTDLAAGTTAVKASEGWLHGFKLQGGSANTTIVIYDNPSAASGNVRLRGACVIAANDGCLLPRPIKMSNGITAVVAGTGGTAQVLWE